MFELRVVTGFAAAHRLTMVGEKCENLHGHNWKVEVYVRGRELDEGGVLVDFGIIKAHVRDLMKTLDHKFLNDLEFFQNGTPPSSENIARYVAEGLTARLAMPPVAVSRVTAWESDNAAATYFPPETDS
ncbi:MAG: 6-carboxytetrahydropterin synthase QueD [Desulfobacterales bacterium]|nr:6-carboxytetrahydropterin synthase QueD [Desulfobacterales bacterium]MDJ0874662.1 6-carboxytetrahydropterin synthase QueD [Desulfobacterales bacterium]